MRYTLKIKATSPEIEYSNLWDVFMRLPFYRTNGYYPVLPRDIRFLEVAVMSPNFPKGIREKLFPVFVEEIYDTNIYRSGEMKLKKEIDNVYSILSRIISDTKVWGFKVFPSYEISITKYGVGGNCNEQTGEILLVINNLGDTFVKDTSSALIHEIVHIGVGDVIVSKYKLSHSETEQLVDWVCSLYISSYSKNERFGNDLVEFLGNKDIKNLPQYIKEFKKSQLFLSNHLD